MDVSTIVKSLVQIFFGLLFVIDCTLNGRISMTIMFGGFFSNFLNFPFLVVILVLITLTSVFFTTPSSILTSVLILTILRTILVDMCALLSSSLIEAWISAAGCLTLVFSIPIGLALGLMICGLSRITKSGNVRMLMLSFVVCTIACTWIDFLHSNQIILISRTVQVYSRPMISAISLLHICYLFSNFNSKSHSLTLCLALLISTLYPGLKRQLITKSSSFELIDSSLSTSLVTVVNDRDLDVKIMRIDHSIVGGVFNAEFESVFETFYWYELACHVPWMKSHSALKKRDALVVGCGVGIVVDALINRCKFDQVVVVDNNADVLNFASKHFGLNRNASLINADGLEFIMAQDTNMFELIVHDVFSGLLMRSTYLQELISNCFRILSRNGILVLNVVSTVEMEVLHSVIQQLQSVFKQIKCFCEDGIHSVNTGAFVNFIFFASKGEEPLLFDTVSNNVNEENSNHAALNSAFEKFKSSEIQLTNIIKHKKNNQRKVEWFVERSNFNSMRKMLPASFWLLY